jgi:DNA-binding transcriptional LysR family regulator
MIESSWLLTFASFAEDANMSRAAKRLHLTQPAVHGHLRKLGEELGTPLYGRRGRALVLTAEGLEVAAYAREHAEREKELRATLAGEVRAEPVVLAAGAGAIRYVVGAALPSFQRQTKVRIEVRALETAPAVIAVRSGEAHVGVGVLTSLPDDLVCSKITAVAQVLVLPRRHPLAKKRHIRLVDLASEPWVLPPEGRPQQKALTDALRERGIEPIVGAVARGWEVTIKLVELGLGLGVVNAFCELPRSLVSRPLPELRSVPYYVFTRKNPRPNARTLAQALLRKG